MMAKVKPGLQSCHEVCRRTGEWEGKCLLPFSPSPFLLEIANHDRGSVANQGIQQKKGRKKVYRFLPFFRSSVESQDPAIVAASTRFAAFVKGLCRSHAAAVGYPPGPTLTIFSGSTSRVLKSAARFWDIQFSAAQTEARTPKRMSVRSNATFALRARPRAPLPRQT